MAKHKDKPARVPDVKNEPDPADAFARVDPIPPGPDAEIDWDRADPMFAEPEKPKKKKGGARAPKVEIATLASDDDDKMEPEDLAAEVVQTLDGAFAMLSSFRGYHLIQMQDGTFMIQHVLPDEAKKERLRKAIIRMAKSAGVSMSPGAALAWTAFGCYGAPVIALEVARYGSKEK